MAKVHIVVGSVMGTALGVAHHAQSILQGLGHEVVLHEFFQQQNFDPTATLLVCTSSTGMGDLPENILPFYQFLITSPPKLTELKYSVISLGDSSYPNFAEAGKTMDATLEDLGATRLTDTLVLDAILVDDHEAESSDWIQQWAKMLQP